MESLEHLIDITSMGRVCRGVKEDKELTNTVKVNGDREYMGKLATMMVNGDLEGCKRDYREGKWEPYHGNSIPHTRMVYVIYLSPYYLFIDSGKPLD